MNRIKLTIYLVVMSVFIVPLAALAQDSAALDEAILDEQPIFDDRLMLEGYTQKYSELPKDIILEMIKDDTLSPFKMAAAIRVFNTNFASDSVAGEKRTIEKILLRRLNKTDSAFVEVEVMCTLCEMDRYRYYNSMVPALIQKLNHYNSAINDIAFGCLDHLTKTGNGRAREARLVFNTLRKILFLSRKHLEKTTEPDEKLQHKLTLLRWSIKVLGSQELRRLPKEVMHLL